MVVVRPTRLMKLVQHAYPEAARFHEGSARCGLYLLTCWSNENADELFLDVVCDGGHDAHRRGQQRTSSCRINRFPVVPQRIVRGSSS